MSATEHKIASIAERYLNDMYNALHRLAIDGYCTHEDVTLVLGEYFGTDVSYGWIDWLESDD